MAGCTMGWIGSREYRGAKRADLLLLMIRGLLIRGLVIRGCQGPGR
jgi:hypothetical protein